MKKLMVFFAVTSFCLSIIGQSPSIEWAKTFGGSENDFCYAIQPVEDGGYLMASITYSNNGMVESSLGNGDAWVIKTGNDGEIEWSAIFGGSEVDIIRDMAQTEKGEFILVGASESKDNNLMENKGKTDAWILKISGKGKTIWSKSYGGELEDDALAVCTTSDGGCIIAAMTLSSSGDVPENKGEQDIFVLKLDKNGEIEWKKIIGGSKTDMASKIIQADDGSYLIAGYSSSADGDLKGNRGDDDALLIKLDKSGNLKWIKNFGGTGADEAADLIETQSGNLVYVGNTKSIDGDISNNHGNWDYWVIKMTPEADWVWEKCFGGTEFEKASSITETMEGDYIIGGVSASRDNDVTVNYGRNDYWMLKVKPDGEIIWQMSVGGNHDDLLDDICNTPEKGCIAVGRTFSNNGRVQGNHGKFDVWTIKLKPFNTK